jgi:hypothetical protein
MLNVYDMTLEELRAAYISHMQHQESAKEAVSLMQAEINDLKVKNAVLEAQKAQWSAASDTQNMVVQQSINNKDLELQEMANTITELRARLRTKGD